MKFADPSPGNPMPPSPPKPPNPSGDCSVLDPPVDVVLPAPVEAAGLVLLAVFVLDAGVAAPLFMECGLSSGVGFQTQSCSSVPAA